jgi:predicted dehydrogenase
MKIGVAGLRRGQSFLRVFAEREDCEVTALCDLSEDTLQSVGDKYDITTRVTSYDDLLASNVDTVVIATPAPLHAQQAISALDAGRNVLSEVPAAWSLDECHALVSAAERSSGVYMLAENMCYFHYLITWREQIRAGEIGRVTYVEAEYIHDCRTHMASDGWRGDMPPIYYATHSLGPVLDILDDRCVQAIGLSTGSRISPEFDAPDMEVGLFTTQNGVTIKILCGFKVARSPAFHWQVFYGTEGVIENGRPPGDSAKTFRDGDTGMRDIPADVSDPGLAESVTGGHGTSEALLIDDFVRAITQGEAAPIDVYRAVEMTAPGLCAHQSAIKGGQPVAIPDFRS